MISGMVSVVIPSYNYGRYVTQAVDGALAQTYRNIEVIVVDDGSTDDTRERLAPYGDRIRYIYRENGGLPAARNTAIRAARGEWVALLDADDLWHAEKTEVQLRAAHARGLGDCAVIGSLPVDGELPEHLPPDPEVRRLGLRHFFLANPFGTTSALIRRACFDEVGLFDETLRAVEDRDMWLRIAARFPIAQAMLPCWWYRMHPEQMHRDPSAMYANYARVLDNFFAAHPEARSYRDLAWSFFHFDAAWAYEAAGYRATALRHILRSLARYPWAFYPDEPDGPAREEDFWIDPLAPRRWRRPRVKMLVRLLGGEGLCRGLGRLLHGASWDERPALSAPATSR
jgi:glycosyltransferase involved in cell wall biosynthesis